MRPIEKSGGTWLARTRGRFLIAKDDPKYRLIGSAVGLISSIIALFEFVGTEAGVAGMVLVLAYFIRDAYRQRRRVQWAQDKLLAELPHQHSFLVEVLRQTYGFPDTKGISAVNDGLVIHSYENNFIVNGVDCSNHQVVVGRNGSDQPVRGIAFALVGGSSLDAVELGSSYTINNGASRFPEFVRDEDRFKIVFNEFTTPLAPQEQFELKYSDNWKGSMRVEADGFFFPESLYFPSGIHRLGSRVNFSFPVSSIAVLEVDVGQSIVRTCRSQPRQVASPSEAVCSYEWSIDSPLPNCIYILYYRAVRRD